MRWNNTKHLWVSRYIIYLYLFYKSDIFSVMWGGEHIAYTSIVEKDSGMNALVLLLTIEVYAICSLRILHWWWYCLSRKP